MRSSTKSVLRISISGLVATQRFIPSVLPTDLMVWETMQMPIRRELQYVSFTIWCYESMQKRNSNSNRVGTIRQRSFLPVNEPAVQTPTSTPTRLTCDCVKRCFFLVGIQHTVNIGKRFTKTSKTGSTWSHSRCSWKGIRRFDANATLREFLIDISILSVRATTLIIKQRGINLLSFAISRNRCTSFWIFLSSDSCFSLHL